MSVSVDEAKRVARLARLRLSDEELESYAGQLSAVLNHFESLAEFAADRRGTASVTGADGSVGFRVDAAGPLRRDIIGDQLEAGDALRNAPESGDGMFSVPGFLPDEP